MIRKAKRSSAANFDGSGPLGSVFGRRAFAIRGASSDGGGSGARSHRVRRVPVLLALVLLGAFTFAFLGTASANKVPVASFCTSGTQGGQCKAEATSPRGLAVNQSTGNVYVADAGNNRVEEFSSNGSFIRTWGWGVITVGKPNEVKGNAQQLLTVKAEGGTFTLTFGGKTTGGTGTGNLTEGSNQITGVITSTGAFVAGEVITGTKIPAGTTISSVGVGTLTLSAAVEAGGTANGVALAANLPFNATAATLKAALEALTSIGAGNIEVSGGPGNTAGTHPYLITFVGALKETGESAITASATSLTGTVHTATIEVVNGGGTGLDVCDTTAGNVASDCKAGTSGAGAGQLQSPSGLAIDQSTGNVYVAGTGSRVDEFSEKGAFIRRFGADVVASGPDQSNEIQVVTVSASGGDFTLSFGSGGPGVSETSEISATATAAQVQSALNAITNISTGGGSVTVSGGPGNVGGTTPYVVTFSGGPLADVNVAQMTAASGAINPLTGGASTASVATSNEGATGFEVCSPGSGDICKAGLSNGQAGALSSSGSGQLAIDPTSHNVLVADAGNVRIEEYSAAGAFIRAFGRNVVSAGPDNNPTSPNEVQKLTVQATSGTFTLSFSGKTTGSLPFNATATEVQVALEGLSNIGAGNVTVSGGPGDANGSHPYTLTFGGTLAGTDIAQITVNIGGLGIAVGAELSCIPGDTNASASSLSAHWLANGTPIPGATSFTYKTQASDEGKAIQCEVLDANTTPDTTTHLNTGVAQISTPATVVSTFPAVAPPTPPASVTFTSNGNFGGIESGSTLTCAPGIWNGVTEPFKYRWYSDGVPVAGQTSSTYTIPATNELAQQRTYQCAVIGANAGGAVALISAKKNSSIAPSPAPASAVTAAVPSPTSAATTTEGNSGFEVCKLSVDVCQPGIASAAPGLFGATSPTRLAVDTAGNVYALDAPNSRVEKLAPAAGSFTVSEFGPAGPTVAPFALAVDPSDNHVFISRRAAGGNTEMEVAEYSSAGALLDTHAVGFKVGEGETPQPTGGGLDVNSASGVVYLSVPSAESPRVLLLTNPPNPVATVSAPAAVTTNSAVLHGSVDPEGFSSGYHFEISTNGATWTKVPATDVAVGNGSTPVEVERAVSGLQPGAVYHVRVVATSTINPAINNTSSEVLFETAQAPPQVLPLDASPVAATTAKLRGYVNPDNAPTSYYYEWGETTSYGNQGPADTTPFIGSGGQALPAPVTISGLQPETTYHFRLVASSPVGTTHGPDREFTTLSPALCSNQGLREVNGSTALPECRAYELTTPMEKKNGSVVAVSAPGFALVTPTGFSPDGSEVFVKSGLLPWEETSNRGTQIVLRRGLGGWSFSDPAPSSANFDYSQPRWPTRANPSSSDQLWILHPNGSPQERAELYRRTPDGEFVHIGPMTPPSMWAGKPSDSRPGSPPMEVIQAEADPGGGAGFTNAAVFASSDFSHVFFSSSLFEDRAFGLPAFPTPVWPGDGTVPNAGPSRPGTLYEYLSTGHTGEGMDVPAMIAVDNTDTQITHCGTGFGAMIGNDATDKTLPSEHAVSAAGGTVFFSAGPGGCNIEIGSGKGNDNYGPSVGQLFARVGEPGAQTTVNLAGISSCETAPHGACNVTAFPQYQGAAADGSKAFFTTAQALPVTTGTPDVDTTSDIYECGLPGDDNPPPTPSAAGVNPCPSLRSITATGASTGANVQEVVSISEDGSHVYYLAKGVVTSTPNQFGQRATQGANNLYLYERNSTHPSGRTLFIASLAASKLGPMAGTNNSSVVSASSEATPDGHYLIFADAADPTPDDTSTVKQIFRYDAANGELIRVSHGQNGFNEDGNTNSLPASIGLFGANSISNDGSSIVFQSTLALVPGVNGANNNVYLWHDGNISLISDGLDHSNTSGDETAVTSTRLLGITPSGSDIFFTSHDRLVPEDVDNSNDLYDARVGGGFPYQPPVPCDPLAEASCQGPPAPVPSTPNPSSSAFSGPGNVPTPVPTKHTHRKKHHHGKSHKRSAAQAANRNRGGSR